MQFIVVVRLLFSSVDSNNKFYFVVRIFLDPRIFCKLMKPSFLFSFFQTPKKTTATARYFIPRSDCLFLGSEANQNKRENFSLILKQNG